MQPGGCNMGLNHDMLASWTERRCGGSSRPGAERGIEWQWTHLLDSVRFIMASVSGCSEPRGTRRSWPGLCIGSGKLRLRSRWWLQRGQARAEVCRRDAPGVNDNRAQKTRGKQAIVR